MRPVTRSSLVCAALGVLGLLGACAHPRVPPAGRPTEATMKTAGGPIAPGGTLIPWPTSATISETARFELTKETAIDITPGQPDLRRMARSLADLVRPALDATLTVRESPEPSSGAGGVIRLAIAAAGVRAASGVGSGAASGAASGDTADESYELMIDANGARITGATAAGVFYGLQTLRQLLPAAVEARGARPRAISLPHAHIVDRPRFGWRGAMLDVARHFFGPADVKRYIDLLALYKFNRLHLHLADDQGWRIDIASWPNLARHGGRTAVGGGPGGFYTKPDYADLVSYARDRFITIVPEIDMPSHINAALASYPELNCDGVAPPLYTGIDVGFSSFCVDKDVTYTFIDDVIGALAAMTPSPWIHIGGDEVKKLTPAQYAQFVQRVQGIVQSHGKVAIGWDEIVHSTLLPSTLVQYWRPDASITPPPATRLVFSPANKVYLDMKYDDETVLGLTWAGRVDVETAYDWDPATLLPGVAESAVLGVEAPLWSETVVTMADVEYLVFPRIAAVAEVAWTPQAARRWDGFAVRLGAQAPRWQALGINAYWSPKIPWRR